MDVSRYNPSMLTFVYQSSRMTVDYPTNYFGIMPNAICYQKSIIQIKSYETYTKYKMCKIGHLNDHEYAMKFKSFFI